MSKKKLTFTNSVGETFDLFPANPLEKDILLEQQRAEWKAAGRPLPELPTYEVETVTGEKQRVAVDTAEKAAAAGIGEAWLAYERAQQAFNAEHSTRHMKSLFLCVDADPEQYPLWKRRMKALGKPLPEDEDERFQLFCQTWVIRSMDDLGAFVIAVTGEMTGMNEEAQAAALAKFRPVLEKAFAEATTASGG